MIDTHPDRMAKKLLEMIDDLLVCDGPTKDHTLGEWAAAIRKLEPPCRLCDLVNITGMIAQHARTDMGYEDA